MTQLTAVLDFSDAIVFLISVPNIIALYLFAPEVKQEVNAFLKKLKAQEKEDASKETAGQTSS